MEVKWVGKHKETLVVSICRVGLNLYAILLEKLPVFTVFKRGFNKDAVQICREILTANYLANEMDFWFEVSPCAQIVSDCLDLVHLFLLHVLECLSVLCIIITVVVIVEASSGLVDGLVLLKLAWNISGTVHDFWLCFAFICFFCFVYY